MNTKEYISSGILEAYVLGALSAGERTEVDAIVAQYTDVKQELTSIEDAMFAFAKANAVQPPAQLADKIWGVLAENKGSATIESVPVTPAARTIPFNPPVAKGTIQWRNAAAVAVLIGSVAVNYVFWNKSQDEHREKVAMQAQMSKLETDQKALAEQVTNYESSKAMMADTAVQTIVMHTVVKAHPMAATLYWSKAKGDAYVAMNALPAPPAGMQYQLWVIQKGKPVSMGMLPNNMANSALMEKIQMQVTDADAFAISLEKAGGNPTPTTVYVLGKA